MDGMETLSRPSSSLPSINMLDAKRADSVSAPVSYSTPAPPQYAHPPSTSSTSAAIPPGLISPPGSRRTSGADQEQRPVPPRISLPSIHETLRSETPTGYSVQPPPPPPQTTSYYQAPATRSPPDSAHRPYASEQPPPSSIPAMTNGYAQRTTSPYTRRADIVPPPPASYSQADRTPGNAPPSSRLPSLHPLQTDSPTDAPRYGYSQQQSPRHEMPPPYPSQATPPHSGYAPYQQHPYSAPPTSVPPHVAFGRSAPPAGPFPNGYQKVEEVKRSSLLPGQAYGESVKRHLETFDYEASLNEIADTNAQLLEFANQYRRLAHQSQRSGLLPRTSPGVPEIDEMLRKAQLMQDALRRVKDVVLAQNVVATEQLAQEERYKGHNGFHSDSHSEYGEESKLGGFAGNDPKKRRGRAAPPGRCHSCNRAETPEWRRGPDGARTLCNACGLHYAKLTRKMGGSSKQSLGGSNLRPKGADSPTLS